MRDLALFIEPTPAQIMVRPGCFILVGPVARRNSGPEPNGA